MLCTNVDKLQYVTLPKAIGELKKFELQEGEQNTSRRYTKRAKSLYYYEIKIILLAMLECQVSVSDNKCIKILYGIYDDESYKLYICFLGVQ